MSTIGHVYAYQVSDRPDAWLRVIAPLDTIESLRDDLLEKFSGRLLALRNESDPAAVIVIGADARRQAPPVPTIPPGRRTADRHRWDKVEVHRYRCRRCQIERRNWIDPETRGWFSTFALPGGEPRRSTHTPPCGAR